MKLRNVIETCDIRHTYNLGCRKCRYQGKICNQAKLILKVSKPYEYIDRCEVYKFMKGVVNNER